MTCVEGQPAIIMPGTEAYKTAWERTMRGSKNLADMEERVKDFIANSAIPKEKDKVSAKTGSIDPQKTPDDGDRSVLLMRDHHLQFPELNLRILVTGPPEDARGFPQLFSRCYCKMAKDIDDADLVVFTGGPDVDPAYYGADRMPNTYVDDARDEEDLITYINCLEDGVPMLGVCRGAQFLAVMNGAKLYQDVDHHNTDHSMIDCRSTPSKILERVSSRHHQAVVPCVGMEIIGKSFKSTERWLSSNERMFKHTTKEWAGDVEAYVIRDTCCIGVQGHPEYTSFNQYAVWCMELIAEYVILNPDIDLTGDRRRLKAEFIAEREFRRQVYPPVSVTKDTKAGDKEVITLGPPPMDSGPKVQG